MLIAATTCCQIGLEFAQDFPKKELSLAALHGRGTVVLKGLQRSLPFTLILVFIVAPSTATRIFKAFLCDPFEYADGDIREYLHDDLAMSCTSKEYESTRSTALGMLIVWPVGEPGVTSKVPLPNCSLYPSDADDMILGRASSQAFHCFSRFFCMRARTR